MARINYGRESGSTFRWIVGLMLALALTVGMVAVGRLVALQLCDGACSALDPLGGFLREPFLIFGETVNWCMGLAAVLGTVLWLALGTRQNGLAVLLIVALGVLGAAMAGRDAPTVVPVEEDVAPPVEVVEPAPQPRVVAPEPIPEPEPVIAAVPDCAEADFWDGGACVSCLVSETRVVTETLRFSPLGLSGGWEYADDRHFRLNETSVERPITDLASQVEQAVTTARLCASDGVLVIGSASSDGPYQRNQDRARARARQLSTQVSAMCPTMPAIFALSFGQSTAPRDNFKDRTLTVLTVNRVDEKPLSVSALEAELGYLLNEAALEAPLFDRLRYFPRENWSWVEGGTGRPQVELVARPMETLMQRRVGAPESCPMPR